MATLYLETPWDTAPDSTSKYEIYNPDDQWIMGNATDPTQKYDGTDFTDLEGGAPKGNILIVYKGRLMIAGDPSFPHRIWYSHIRNGEGWSKNFDWIDIYPEDGGSLNAMSIQNDELIASKSNGRKYGWRIQDDGDPTNSRLRIIEDDKGSVGKRAETTMQDTHYYYDRDGIFTIPRGEPGGLSHIIQEVTDGLTATDLSVIAAGSNDSKVYFAVGDLSIDLGDTVDLTNALIVYDSVHDNFYLRDNIQANVFTKFIDSTGTESLYFGDNSGKVYQLESGTTAGSSPINMRVRTKPYFRVLGKQVTVYKVGIYMDKPDGTSVAYRTNLTEPFSRSLGSVTKEPVQWFDVKDATGPLFQMEFTHGNSTVRPTILGWAFLYDLEGEKLNED